MATIPTDWDYTVVRPRPWITGAKFQFPARCVACGMDLGHVAFRPCDNCHRPICEGCAIDLGVKLEPVIGRDLAGVVQAYHGRNCPGPCPDPIRT